MKKFILSQLLVIGILNSYAPISNALSSGAQIAIGHYIPTAPGTNPWPQAFILHSNDDGSWSNQDIPWNDHPSSSQINDTYCNEKNCIATAYHLSLMDDHYQESFPSFVMSNDYGKSWYINKNITGLPEMRGGYTKSIYCKDSMCLSIGNYEDPGIRSMPMLLTSYNNGQSWSYTSLPFPVSMPDRYHGSLNALACLNNIYLIAGSYDSNGEDKKLVFFRSQDKGQTWSLSHISGIPKEDNINVKYIKCNTSICLAAGNYTIKGDRSDAENVYPLLLLSKDKGKSWNFVDKLLVPKMDNLIINDIIESNGSFILVGGYGFVSIPYQYKGFILTSPDNGESWSFINKKPGGDKNELMAPLNAITCTDNICIIGGNNDNGLNFFISHDRGLFWSPIQRILGMNEIPNIDKIQCSGNDCTVFGSFIDKRAGHPVAILSHDKGETWSANKIISNFPENINELHFSDIK